MVTKEEIERINILSKKSKTSGLDEDEKIEQKKLRQKYLDSIKNSFTNQLSTMKIVDSEGTDVTPEKLKQLKKDKKNIKDDK